MEIKELSVGDLVTRIGDQENKYLVTSTKATRGISDYVTILGPDGHAYDVWAKYIKEKVGFIDIGYIFDALLGSEK